MRVNVLGNGDWADIFQRGTEGKLLVCNMPPMQLTKQEVYASCMVDFKMMAALQEGSVNLGMYDWILGNRPRRWMEQNPKSPFFAARRPDLQPCERRRAGRPADGKCGPPPRQQHHRTQDS